MKKYLAKSRPEETIQEHTDELLKNFKILKQLYPNIKVEWNVLYKACLYHDLGKINSKFQEKLKTFKRIKGEIPHGILSLLFLNNKEIKNEFKDIGYTEEESRGYLRVLHNAIGYHHERKLDFEIEDIESESNDLQEQAKNFEYDKLKCIKLRKKISARYFMLNERIIPSEEGNLYYKYIMTKGLLNRLDFAASAHIKVETKNDFLIKDLNENLMMKFKENNPNAKWNDLQNYMYKNSDKNIVVVAQTGMGKTEAGLLWIGNNKGFFTLPLKTAINSIYNRVKDEIIIKEDYVNKVALLHSDIKKEYLRIVDKASNNNIEIDFEKYYTKTRQLSMPLTICTLDQLFTFVYKYAGSELLLATLSYSKVIIDEVQMYSPDLIAYLVIGLDLINKMGGKFSILTATLPEFLIDLLQENDIKFERPKAFCTDVVRHNIKVIHEEINSEFILNSFNDNKVLVICNTVKQAQKLYGEIQEKDNEIDLNVFHSGFILKDRKLKEEEIFEFARNDDKKGIWITTQVVEASLDIDFDILITELSDLNGLFQRMGRCNRKGEKSIEDYNCFVFNGGDKKTSGIGNVVDKEIFKLSKEMLNNMEGAINEKTKIDIISQNYTKEKLEKTEYYIKIVDTINYIKAIYINEYEKKDVLKMFRNINSRNVIPKCIFEENEELINKCIEILAKKELPEKKLRSRIVLQDFMISIPEYAVKTLLIENIQINKYEYLEIFDCEYNSRCGIKYFQNNKEKINEEDDNIF